MHLRHLINLKIKKDYSKHKEQNRGNVDFKSKIRAIFNIKGRIDDILV